MYVCTMYTMIFTICNKTQRHVVGVWMLPRVWVSMGFWFQFGFEQVRKLHQHEIAKTSNFLRYWSHNSSTTVLYQPLTFATPTYPHTRYSVFHKLVSIPCNTQIMEHTLVFDPPDDDLWEAKIDRSLIQSRSHAHATSQHCEQWSY